MSYSLLVVTFLLVALQCSCGGVEGRDDRPPFHDSELLVPALAKDKGQRIISPLPISYISVDALPTNFSWSNVVEGGPSYLTKALNQHLPQWCGSCWAHGALSALADRIKIARNAQSPDINLAVQFLLNCGANEAGSCHGGSHWHAYQFIQNTTGYIPYDTCMPYLGCSSDSNETELCRALDTTCSAFNICRTCTHDGTCRAISPFPNASIAEYGYYKNDVNAIKAEIYMRGPVAAEVNGHALHDYAGGIFDNATASNLTTHIVSIVGWGEATTTTTTTSDDDSTTQYWIIRNSWGQYWGENLGFGRVRMGQLGLEKKVVWATPQSWTEVNTPCFEDGSNCEATAATYVDPSVTIQHPVLGHNVRATATTTKR
uniref:Peptidase C1A papain C-terminal domain-containing protein n=1 Tax=Grammatophora oceanica TaxID=210454 RepID=A0A7S1VQ97_9STRA|mmetsp:Transcript_51637/g.77048  ORF Transcript_51637/g.77048 Transcript_51637/m.77048 type:complete len:373 (+) Transcript_51637:134-1252(+)